jgi:hypothetical protein
MSGHDHVPAQSTLNVHLPPNLSRQIANAHDHILLQVWQSESAQHALLKRQIQNQRVSSGWRRCC